MNNRSVVAFGAVILIVGVGLAFYWYEYRPSQIRAACETQATEQAVEFLRQIMDKQASNRLPEGMYNQANKEAFYMSCVRQNGLER
jgi:hypothetical protein